MLAVLTLALTVAARAPADSQFGSARPDAPGREPRRVTNDSGDTPRSARIRFGRYEVRDLPAGDYSLKAERGGYLTLAYGQRRVGEVGKPLRLGEGQTVKESISPFRVWE